MILLRMLAVLAAIVIGWRLVHRTCAHHSYPCSIVRAISTLRQAGLLIPAQRLRDAYVQLRNSPVGSASRFASRDKFAHAVMEAHIAYGSRVPGLDGDPYMVGESEKYFGV
jgi:hypothetical protein